MENPGSEGEEEYKRAEDRKRLVPAFASADPEEGQKDNWVRTKLFQTSVGTNPSGFAKTWWIDFNSGLMDDHKRLWAGVE